MVASTGATCSVGAISYAEQTALYAIVAERYCRFVHEIETTGGHIPQFVRREFQDYLKC
jgi:hypothetical protein